MCPQGRVGSTPTSGTIKRINPPMKVGFFVWKKWQACLLTSNKRKNNTNRRFGWVFAFAGLSAVGSSEATPTRSLIYDIITPYQACLLTSNKRKNNTSPPPGPFAKNIHWMFLCKHTLGPGFFICRTARHGTCEATPTFK